MTARVGVSLVTGALLALLLLAAALPAAHGQSSAVQQCIEQNLVRYAEPGTSAEAQYVDVEAACTDVVEEGDSISVAPERPPAPKPKPTPAQPSAPQAPASPEPTQTTPSDGGTTTTEQTRTEPQTTPPPSNDEPGSGDTANAGQQLIVEMPPTSASAPGPFAGVPVWAIGLLVAATLLILVATLLNLRRSRA